MTYKELNFSEMKIDVDHVFHQMGGRGSFPDEGMVAEIQELLQAGMNRIRPRYGYTVKRGALDGGLLTIDGIQLHVGGTIGRQLAGSEAFVLFVATAGDTYSRLMKEVESNDDLVKTYICDALGSVIAERCADRMERDLQLSVDKLGWKHTNRFSPGYCGWHVREQQALFSLMGGSVCGVTLNESCLMSPIKSVSGVIGVGGEVEHLPYSCSLCGRKNCLFAEAESATL